MSYSTTSLMDPEIAEHHAGWLHQFRPEWDLIALTDSLERSTGPAVEVLAFVYDLAASDPEATAADALVHLPKAG